MRNKAKTLQMVIEGIERYLNNGISVETISVSSLDNYIDFEGTKRSIGYEDIQRIERMYLSLEREFVDYIANKKFDTTEYQDRIQIENYFTELGYGEYIKNFSEISLIDIDEFILMKCAEYINGDRFQLSVFRVTGEQSCSLVQVLLNDVTEEECNREMEKYQLKDNEYFQIIEKGLNYSWKYVKNDSQKVSICQDVYKYFATPKTASIKELEECVDGTKIKISYTQSGVQQKVVEGYFTKQGEKLINDDGSGADTTISKLKWKMDFFEVWFTFI